MLCNERISSWLKSLFVVLLSWVVSACGLEVRSDLSSQGPATQEPPYYSKPSDYSPATSVSVSSVALFKYRELTAGSILGNVAATPLPIAYAEFHVYNATGARIQQGETEADGTITFLIPEVTGRYTLKVFSRALNDHLKVSILADLYKNEPHFISKTFEFTGSNTDNQTLILTDLVAEADESISANLEGGAFNIMHQLLISNQYIRRNIEKNGTNGVPVEMNKWWVADKVQVYWRAGFNPASYFKSSAPISFYVPSEKKLFLLGGMSGDVKHSDTDHFDNSIIIHEYAHFLEHAYSNSSSPGGSHNGNAIIDARLSWSEGFANYLQAAILTGDNLHTANSDESLIPLDTKLSFYTDTQGHTDGGSTGIKFPLWVSGNIAGERDSVYLDHPGDGDFRELAVSRALYRMTRSNTISLATAPNLPGASVPFKAVWEVFSGENTTVNDRVNPSTFSLRNKNRYPISNMGLFNYLIYSHYGPAATPEFTAIIDDEKQSASTENFAYLLNVNPACTPTLMGVSARETGNTNESFDSRSHQNANNDFFLIYHDGSNSSIQLTTGSTKKNLDLILYKKDYTYFEDYSWHSGEKTDSIIKQSRKVPALNTPNDETISLAGLAAGFYVLNVKARSYNQTTEILNTTVSYDLWVNGVKACGTER